MSLIHATIACDRRAAVAPSRHVNAFCSSTKQGKGEGKRVDDVNDGGDGGHEDEHETPEGPRDGTGRIHGAQD